MRPLLYKILILHEDRPTVERLKTLVLNSKSNAIFLVAEDLPAFSRKMAWMTPDLMITNTSFDVFSKALSALPGNTAAERVPSIFITEAAHSTVVSTKFCANNKGLVRRAKMDQLKSHLQELLSPPRPEELLLRQRLHESKVALHKAITLLERSNNFPGKEQILNSLQKVEPAP